MMKNKSNANIPPDFARGMIRINKIKNIDLDKLVFNLQLLTLKQKL
jgi:hypothetical protein